jgi:prepilin-type processing-associated H-X9-DG protein/prepilin-type N-terminal cleavage/methylation domain-containing protein
MRKMAFTLVELLVVISVIAVLTAILMPVLGGARQRGKSIVCLSNMRQMAIASQGYINSNEGSYPIAYMYKSEGSTFISYAWDFTTIQNWSPFERKVIPGSLWEGQTIEKVQQCPSFKGDSTWLADPYTGYNYNTSFIGHGQSETCPNPARADMVRKPDRCALFGDGQWKNGANKFMRSPWQSECDTFPFRYAGTQGFRHNGKTNVAYCDGHTATVNKCYKNTELAQIAEIAEGTGFLSPDNSAYDLK